MKNLSKIFLIFTLFVFIVIPTISTGQTATQEQLEALTPEQRAAYENSLRIIRAAQNKRNTNPDVPAGINEQISFEFLPAIPLPGQAFTISIESFSSDLDKASITWLVNGQISLQGIGEKRFADNAPRSGVNMLVTAIIEKPNGGIVEKSFNFTPSDVDIIYEAETYTPPFYKGKSIFTNESLVKLIALPNMVTPNGTRIADDNLDYTWKIDHQVISEASGFGKSVFEYRGKLLQRPILVTVEVSARNSSLIATKTIPLQNFEPQTIIYEINPLLGIIFEQSITGDFMLEREEVEFAAIPFFFSAERQADSFLEYEWFLNGSKINVNSNKSSIIFRNTENQSGSARISLKLEHLNNILQGSVSSISLEFSEKFQDFNF